jgi:hypothetical protein
MAVWPWHIKAKTGPGSPVNGLIVSCSQTDCLLSASESGPGKCCDVGGHTAHKPSGRRLQTKLPPFCVVHAEPSYHLAQVLPITCKR